MPTPNDFWLALHQLAQAYDAAGLTPDERATRIVEQFRDMPAIAQREVLGDLLRVITHCPDLYPLVASAAKDNEKAAPRRKAAS
jgi:hypothetical protein